MVAADALTILGGAIAGKHLPERFIQLFRDRHARRGPLPGGADPGGRR